MIRAMLATMILLAAVLLLGGCTPSSPKPVSEPSKRPDRPNLQLEQRSDGSLFVTLDNPTANSLLVSLHRAELVLYVAMPDGSENSITFDGSNTEFAAIGPFDTTLLPPRSSLVMRMVLWEIGKARLKEVWAAGLQARVVARLEPFGPGSVEPELVPKLKNAPRLVEALESNAIILRGEG